MYAVYNQQKLQRSGFATIDQAAAYILDMTDRWPSDDVMEIASPSDVFNALTTRERNPILQDWQIIEA